MPENKAIINERNIIGQDGTFDALFKNLDELENRLKRLAQQTKKELDLVNPSDITRIKEAEKALNGYEDGMKEINKQRKVAISQRKKLNDLTDEELIQREAEKASNRDRVRRAKQLAIIRKEERDTIKSLRAQLSLVSLDWSKLTEEEIKNGKQAKALTAQKLALTKQLKRLEEATDDHRRTVGKYSIATAGLGKTLKRIFIGRTIVDGILRIGGAFVQVAQDGAGVDDRLGNLVESGDKLKNVFTGLAAEILIKIAPLFTRIVDTVSFVIEKFRQLSNSSGLLGEAFTFLGELVMFPINLILDMPAIFSGIVEGGRQLANNIGASFKKLGLRLEILFANLEKVNPFSSKSSEDIAANIRRLNNEVVALSATQTGVFEAYERGFAASKKEQEEFSKKQGELEKLGERINNQSKGQTKEIEKQNKLLEEQKRLTSDRLKAIEEIQSRTVELTAENIKDAEARAFRLENLRFQTEQEERKANAKKLLELLKREEELTGKELNKEREAIRKADEELALQQLEAFEQKKAAIRKQFLKDTELIETKSVLGDAAKEEQAFLDKKVEMVDASNEKIKDSNKKLFEDITATSAKVAEAIAANYEKQNEAAISAVEAQTTAVEQQQERANLGLQNTLKFEQEELAKRQSEQLQAQRRQQQAAELLTLYNLVSAYAQSGDENALQRGLVDIAALKAVSGLQGFYEGTENVEKSLGGQQAFNTKKDAFLGVTKSGKQFRFDGSERIVKGSHNAILGNMSNDDLIKNALVGQQIGDYMPLLDSKHFKEQSLAMTKGVVVQNNDSRLLDEMKKTRIAIERNANNSFEIEEITDLSINIAKKVTEKRMKRVERVKKYF